MRRYDESLSLPDLIIDAEERLKRTTAEVLHGRIQTRLLVASYRLGQCQSLVATDPRRAERLLEQVRKELDDIREHDVREVSHLLHPSIIRVGLLPALRTLIQRFEDRFRIVVQASASVEDIDKPDDPQIPEKTRLLCYRVIEEALANAARHADARSVLITLTVTARGELEFKVEDDGIGFSLETTKPGLGLSMVAARLARIGGAIDIVSRPGAGTVVMARIPLTELFQ